MFDVLIRTDSNEFQKGICVGGGSRRTLRSHDLSTVLELYFFVDLIISMKRKSVAFPHFTLDYSRLATDPTDMKDLVAAEEQLVEVQSPRTISPHHLAPSTSSEAISGYRPPPPRPLHPPV